MKLLFLLILSCCLQTLYAQELFVYTEPASNMAAKSVGVRLSNSLMKEKESSGYEYQMMPEVMWGISKKIMIHVEGFFGNANKKLQAEGSSLF